MNNLGYNVISKDNIPCEACAEDKTNQKSLNKKTIVINKVVKHVTIPNGINEKASLDISTIKAPKGVRVNVTKPQWRILIDHRTMMKFSDFYCKKSDMVEPTCELFNKWKEERKPVKQLRCDNAGENISLEKRQASAAWKMNIKFEYTAKHTPQ